MRNLDIGLSGTRVSGRGGLARPDELDDPTRRTRRPVGLPVYR